MAESFNSVLKGIRGMPVNAIVMFSFSKMVAWFNKRYEEAKELQRNNQLWAPRPLEHLQKAKEKAHTHEVECFDNEIGKYEITERGATTSDGEVKRSRCYVVVLVDFSCTCGRPRQYHTPCSHDIAVARHSRFDFKSQMPRELSVDSLLLTWSPRYEPYLDEGQWPPYTGPKYIADPGCRWNKRGSRKRLRHNMSMDQVSGRTRHGRARPFVTDPEQSNCRRCSRVRHNVRRCTWPISQVRY
ncbi:hypothetical protein C2845_PM07G02240 [Panicum miliaceum]|uniref:SWIM-type domain-containing protein n=1 Tax=Panicum miliaceum TaxID=4540 RepID=A0A3L6SLA6_PANMI|nr:hypothetical protein C2845_PM07G02240 [Panicum miliaceum]